MKTTRVFIVVLAIYALILLSITGCTNKKEETLILATTTSVYDSGLLDYLLPIFSRETGIKVKPVAVGTGEALKMGAKGDADILIVHAPEKEKELIKNGQAAKRHPFMFNYFFVVGPKDDPAKIDSAKTAHEAFTEISRKKHLFVSRGDKSGTHIKEQAIWSQAQVKPQSNHYLKTGQGMGATLLIANEKNGYALTDKATYLVLKSRLKYLKSWSFKDASLKNTYSVIELNSGQVDTQEDKAKKFKNWLLSKKTLDKISDYGKKKYKEGLFSIEGT